MYMYERPIIVIIMYIAVSLGNAAYLLLCFPFDSMPINYMEIFNEVIIL